MYKKHTDLSPGTPHLEGLLENLPDTLEDDEVMIACYAHQEGQIMVVGYYKTKGYYEGRIAYPDGFRGDISVSDCVYSLKAKEVCKRDDCWAGGDTGDFYYNPKVIAHPTNANELNIITAFFEALKIEFEVGE